MQLRKRAPAARVVDEPGGEDHDLCGTDSGSCRVTNEEDCEYDPSVSEEEEDGDDDEYKVKSTSKKKPTSSKSKRPVADRGKAARKSKRENETAEQRTKERPEKFSHSSRRNKRRADDDLLNTPEDEIDFQRLPIRDIILLAEHKERLAAKEAKTSNSTASRTGDTFDEDGSCDEDQDGGFTEEKAYRRKTSLFLFNHQSFMDKPPPARWSKEDTELFYEGVRQFGTDFSMIQQLFPGRTRHEVKLKFKKEGRQHPSRFSEAQTHRCTDYSFYKKLIERLQEAGKLPAEKSRGDDSNFSPNSQAAAVDSASNQEDVAKSGLDEDFATEDQEEKAAKSKLNKDPSTDAREVNVTQVQNTSQSGEIDDAVDDDDIWKSYKSELVYNYNAN